MLHITHKSDKQGDWPDKTLQGALEKCYDNILEAGLAHHLLLPPIKGKKGKKSRKRRIGHNLLRRLETHKDDVLRFWRDPLVPFTNNQAESDLRMMKVKQKISGGFRSMSGAKIFANLRSLLSSTQKQKLSMMDVINNPKLLKI